MPVFQISYSYFVYLESIDSEAVFTKRRINNKGNIDFLQNSPLGIQYTYSIKFFLGWNFFLWDIKLLKPFKC